MRVCYPGRAGRARRTRRAPPRLLAISAYALRARPDFHTANSSSAQPQPPLCAQMDEDLTSTFPSAMGSLSLSDSNLADVDFGDVSNIMDASFEYDSQPIESYNSPATPSQPSPFDSPSEHTYAGSMGTAIPQAPAPQQQARTPPHKPSQVLSPDDDEDEQLPAGASEGDLKRAEELRAERDGLRAMNAMLRQIAQGFDSVEGKMEVSLACGDHIWAWTKADTLCEFAASGGHDFHDPQPAGPVRQALESGRAHAAAPARPGMGGGHKGTPSATRASSRTPWPPCPLITRTAENRILRSSQLERPRSSVDCRRSRTGWRARRRSGNRRGSAQRRRRRRTSAGAGWRRARRVSCSHHPLECATGLLTQSPYRSSRPRLRPRARRAVHQGHGLSDEQDTGQQHSQQLVRVVRCRVRHRSWRTASPRQRDRHRRPRRARAQEQGDREGDERRGRGGGAQVSGAGQRLGYREQQCCNGFNYGAKKESWGQETRG